MTRSEFVLRCAALAMHAELNSAGSFDEPAKALALSAEREGRSIPEQIAENAFEVAEAMSRKALSVGFFPPRDKWSA